MSPPEFKYRKILCEDLYYRAKGLLDVFGWGLTAKALGYTSVQELEDDLIEAAILMQLPIIDTSLEPHTFRSRARKSFTVNKHSLSLPARTCAEFGFNPGDRVVVNNDSSNGILVIIKEDSKIGTYYENKNWLV